MNKAMNWTMVTVTALALIGGTALAGNTNAPAAPTDPASAMWTLNDIYNVMSTRTTNVTKRTTVFKEPTAGPTGTMHTLNEIMALATNMAPAPRTGQTISNTGATGDDGALQIGVAWPKPRFSALPSGATGQETNQIRDNLTGLIWARDADFAGGKTTWPGAFTTIAASNSVTYAGTNDWRLPNIRELHSLVDFQYDTPALSDGTGTNKWTASLGPFRNVNSSQYWSTTAASPAPSAGQAWYMYLIDGRVAVQGTNTSYYVWPVRGGR